MRGWDAAALVLWRQRHIRFCHHMVDILCHTRQITLGFLIFIAVTMDYIAVSYSVLAMKKNKMNSAWWFVRGYNAEEQCLIK